MNRFGCIAPFVFAVIGAIVVASLAGAVNSAQIGFCDVPNSQFVNAESCRVAIEGARSLYFFVGGLFGAFAGFIAGLIVYILFGRVLRK